MLLVSHGEARQRDLDRHSVCEGLRLLFIGLDAQNRGAADRLLKPLPAHWLRCRSFTLFAKRWVMPVI
jgi:hypothetical protein